MILSLSFEEGMVCRVKFGLLSPVVCVLIYGARLQYIFGRFVVFDGCIFVYGVLAGLFWAVSGVILPWVMAWGPSL